MTNVSKSVQRTQLQNCKGFVNSNCIAQLQKKHPIILLEWHFTLALSSLTAILTKKNSPKCCTGQSTKPYQNEQESFELKHIGKSNLFGPCSGAQSRFW